MEQRIYQGSIHPNALAQHLLDSWEQDDTLAQAMEGDEGIIVQVGQRSGVSFNFCIRCGTNLNSIVQVGQRSGVSFNFCIRCGTNLNSTRSVGQ